ncbi:MAG: ribbon-helix-helix domain-containing protein [Chloroflexi bacterium]|nr:ribbon-helix-helix domain-containing protein [Chloroflexota bacterium]
MTTRTNITLTEDMHDALNKLSDERGVPIAYIIREAVAAYLERSRIRIQNIHPDWGGRRDDDKGGGDDRP